MEKVRVGLDRFDYVYIVIGLPWLFLMLFTSRMYTEIKTVMLALLVMVSGRELLSKRIKTNNKEIRFVSIFIIYIVLSLLYGIIMGYEYEFFKDFSLVQYYIITPICIVIFSTVFSNNSQRVEFVWKTLVFLTLFLSIIDVVRVFLYTMGIDPPFLQFIMMASDNIVEKLALRVSNEPSLMFLIPVFIYLLINSSSDSRKNRLIYLTIVIFGIIYAILSGRKMLELMILVSFFISFTFPDCKFSLKRIFGRKMVSIVLGVILFVFVIAALLEQISTAIGVDNILSLAYETISNGLSSDAHGVTKREENTLNLINLWMESPLWGNGLNSYVENSVASSITKWSYEVVYVAWLAQTGIIGLYLLYFPIIYIIKKLKNKAVFYNDKRFFALAVGFISFVICGASNPMVYIIWPWSICMIFCKYNKALKTNTPLIENKHI